MRIQYKKKEQARTDFYRDPYRFIKSLFDEERSGFLRAPVKKLEEYLRNSYYDTQRQKPVTP